jgi:hypothetical protein
MIGNSPVCTREKNIRSKIVIADVIPQWNLIKTSYLIRHSISLLRMGDLFSSSTSIDESRKVIIPIKNAELLKQQLNITKKSY